MDAFVPVASSADGEDRISALHDDLLRIIISLLPVKDAARTSTFASRWRHIWRSSPLFLSDDDLLPSAVTRVLSGHPGPFSVVEISRCRFASHDYELTEWPRLLAAKGVHHLLLANSIDESTVDDSSSLPADILRCASLRDLFLGRFSAFPDTAGLPRGPDVFPHLHQLGTVMMTISGWDLDYILACSPVLQTFIFAQSTMPNLLQLRSQSLRCVTLWNSTVDGVTMVDAPLLERLFLLEAPRGGDGNTVVLSIPCASNLRALGYLEPRFHSLHIGDNVIKPGTMPTPSTVVPGIKILACKVNFGVLHEVKMLVAFLRCFPNIDTLHVESLTEPTGRSHAKFWEEVFTIECIKSHVKKIVVHEYRGDQSELEFLQFIVASAHELRTLSVLISKNTFTNLANAAEMTSILGTLSGVPWRRDCKMTVLGPEFQNEQSILKASDLTVDDPFDW